MNPQTAALTILFGFTILFAPVTVPALTFEQRWEPVKQLPPMIDKSPRELTFEERWEPVRRLPQMLPGKADRDDTPPQGIVRAFRVTRQVEGVIPGAAPILPTHAFVKDERDIGEGAGNSGTRPTGVERAKTEIVGRTVPSPMSRPRTIRKAELDICQRHNMRKVHYGKTWRCRK